MRAELEALERDFRGQAESAESPEEAETFCYCADRLAALRAGVVGEDAVIPASAALTALHWLRDSHVQDNKYRMGALGASDIDYAVNALTAALGRTDTGAV